MPLIDWAALRSICGTLLIEFIEPCDQIATVRDVRDAVSAVVLPHDWHICYINILLPCHGEWQTDMRQYSHQFLRVYATLAGLMNHERADEFAPRTLLVHTNHERAGLHSYLQFTRSDLFLHMDLRHDVEDEDMEAIVVGIEHARGSAPGSQRTSLTGCAPHSYRTLHPPRTHARPLPESASVAESAAVSLER